MSTASSSFGESFDPPPSDRKSLVVDFPSNRPATLDDYTVSNTLSVYTTSASRIRTSSIYSEYDISNLNPEGIFKATVAGTFLSTTAPSNFPRRIEARYYSGNGTIERTDATATAIQDLSIGGDQNFAEMPARGTSLVFNHRVAGTLREILSDGGTHFGVRLFGDSAGTSVMSSTDPVTLHINEYYANPYDGLKQITGETGLAFRGHEGEFITRGTSQLISPENRTFSVFLGPQNSVNVQISQVLGPSWGLNMNSPDGSLLKAGDTYLTHRFSDFNTGFAGLDFGGDGRGYNGSNGWFQVNEAVYGANNQILKFDAIFKISAPSNWLGDPAAYGHIKFSSVPEPGALSVIAVTSLTGYLIRRRKNQLHVAQDVK